MDELVDNTLYAVCMDHRDEKLGWYINKLLMDHGYQLVDNTLYAVCMRIKTRN